MGNNTQVLKLQAKAKWAKILAPSKSDYEEHPVYSIALMITDAQFAKLKDKGFKGEHKADKDGDKIVNFKRRTMGRDGESKVPALAVIGRDKLPVVEAVGNGSEVIVVLEINSYDNKFGKGNSFRIGAVQVVDHVIYESSNPHADQFEQLDAAESDGEII